MIDRHLGTDKFATPRPGGSLGLVAGRVAAYLGACAPLDRTVRIVQQYERGAVPRCQAPPPSLRLAAMPQGLPTPTVAVIEAVDHKGWGYGLNFYWLLHPRRLVRARRRSR
jgi:hypothetical protein